ncbi:hypothetical protein NDU88_004048 [Pleurodeles waltl]|uniref:Uncharacterized protein n=1 Tax=Pleurodeles waltl TaxID=8319 RepID=A0AAV7QEU3_PLEWA|nr:hypothetical protein NDU88_004048 [Pleurodeles waltl]
MGRVNAVGPHPRTRDDIRKRWNDLREKVSALSKEGYMACHRQRGADLGGLWQAENLLSQTVGGPEMLGMEEGGGPAGDGLPRRKGCPSNPDPPMAPIMVVACPELDGRLRASQQPQGGEYSAHHYNLRLVECYPVDGCVQVGTPRPGLT